jgi:hypothetical protein
MQLIFNEKITGLIEAEEFNVLSFDKFCIDQTGFKGRSKRNKNDLDTLKELYVEYIRHEFDIKETNISFMEVEKLYQQVYHKRYNKNRNTKTTQNWSGSENDIHINQQPSSFEVITNGDGTKYVRNNDAPLGIVDSIENCISYEEFVKASYKGDDIYTADTAERLHINSKYINYINLVFKSGCRTIDEAISLYKRRWDIIKNERERQQSLLKAKAKIAAEGLDKPDHPSYQQQRGGYKKRGYQRRAVDKQETAIAADKINMRTVNLISEWFELYIDWRKIVTLPVMTLPQFENEYKDTIVSMWKLDTTANVDGMFEVLYKRYLNQYRTKRYHYTENKM